MRWAISTSGPVFQISSARSLVRSDSSGWRIRYRRVLAPVFRCTSIGLPVCERRKRVGAPHRQRLAGAFQRQPVGQRVRQQLGDGGEPMAAPDVVGQRGERGRLVVPGAQAEVALQQPELGDQRVDLVQRGGHGRTRDVAHRRAAEELGVLPAEIFQRPPGEDREQEVVIVELVLGDGDLEQMLEHAHRRQLPEQVERVVIAGVEDAAPAAMRNASSVASTSSRSETGSAWARM